MIIRRLRISRLRIRRLKRKPLKIRSFKIKVLKRAVLTVEAAVIVPIAATVLAMLMGYIWFTYERVWSKSAAYEAALYALQYADDGRNAEDRAARRLAERYSESVTGLAKNNTKASESGTRIAVSWSYGVLEEVFGGIFEIRGEIGVRKSEPIKAKRLMWAAGELFGKH